MLENTENANEGKDEVIAKDTNVETEVTPKKASRSKKTTAKKAKVEEVDHDAELLKQVQESQEKKAEEEVDMVPANLNPNYKIPKGETHLVHFVNAVTQTRRSVNSVYSPKQVIQKGSLSLESFMAQYGHSLVSEREFWTVDNPKKLFLFKRNVAHRIDHMFMDSHYQARFQNRTVSNKDAVIAGMLQNLRLLVNVNGTMISPGDIIHFPSVLHLKTYKVNGRNAYAPAKAELWGLAVDEKGKVDPEEMPVNYSPREVTQRVNAMQRIEFVRIGESA